MTCPTDDPVLLGGIRLSELRRRVSLRQAFGMVAYGGYGTIVEATDLRWQHGRWVVRIQHWRGTWDEPLDTCGVVWGREEPAAGESRLVGSAGGTTADVGTLLPAFPGLPTTRRHGAMSDTLNQLGAELRRVRILNGVSHHEICEALGAPSDEVWAAEAGEMVPSDTEVRVWARRCGCDQAQTDKLLRMLSQYRDECERNLVELERRLDIIDGEIPASEETRVRSVIEALRIVTQVLLSMSRVDGPPIQLVVEIGRLMLATRRRELAEQRRKERQEREHDGN